MKWLRKSVAMLLAFIAGVILALATRRGTTTDVRTSLGGGLVHAKGTLSRTADGLRERWGAGSSTREKCRTAWQVMLKEQLPEKEKHQLAEGILKRWAEVDPRGALAAALDAEHHGWNQASNFASLLNAFDGAIADDPLPFLNIISEREFGLDSGAVAARWSEVVARRDPLLVLTSLDHLPAQSHANAIWRAANQMPRHPEQREAILRELEKLRSAKAGAR